MRAAVIATAMCLSAAGLCAGTEANAAIRRQTSIPAQGLGPALQALATQRDFQLIYRAEFVGGLTTPGANGELTVEEALTQLLQGTGLTYRRLDERTVTIIPVPAQATSASVFPSELRFAQVTESSAIPASSPAMPYREELEEIVVTGSHIRGVTTSASPILRFDRIDIQRTGYATVAEFVESLPQNFGGGASQDTVGTNSAVGNNTYGSAVNLRALGPGASLVLVNGRRLAPGGNSGRFIDISMIPLSAVERVEVLTDGASAIYGSDAVGGVVNFILRQDYEGAQTSLRYGRVAEGGLREVHATQSLGANWEGGGTLLSYEYDDRDALDANDRDFARGSEQPRTLLPEQKRHSVYASIHQDFAERWSTFADVLYSQRETRNELSYLSLYNLEESDSDQLYASAGAEVDIDGNWRAQFSAGYSEYAFDASLLRAPASGGEGVLTESTVDTDVWSFDALFDGALMTLPGGSLRLAVGASHRRENVLPIGGDIIPERRVNAAFSELHVPLVGAHNSMAGVRALELTLAARYEDYNDFGEDVTPKFGLRWEPVRGLSLRATYGESFKAPTVAELAPGTESLLAFFAGDFGINVTGDPLILLRAQAARPELEEERSKSWTAGFDWQPAGSALALSATYFRIEFDGRIDVPFAGGFDDFFNSPDVFGDFLAFDPSAAFVSDRLARATDFADLTGGAFAPDAVDIWADVTVTNIAAERQSGIDVLLRYPLQASWGSVEASLNGTYLIDYEKKVAPRAPARDLLNLLNEPIDLRLRGSLAFTRGAATATLFVNYQDDYHSTDASRTPIGSWTTVDMQLRYDLDTAGSPSPLDGIGIALSVQNLFDRDPPFVASQGSPIAHAGYDSVNASPLGRFVALEVLKSW